jgi:hypothetical protein
MAGLIAGAQRSQFVYQLVPFGVSQLGNHFCQPFLELIKLDLLVL